MAVADQRKRSGLRFWPGILRSLIIYWRPGRQHALRALYRPFVPEGGLVFDIGAHVGDRTRAFAALGARVVALEPQPQLHPWLQWSVGRQSAVTLRPDAVGAQTGRAQLAISRQTPTVSTLSTFWQKELPKRNPSFRAVDWDETIEVNVTTLDALIAEFGRPDFCKIDVEGHEEAVLAGLHQPLPALSYEFVAGALDGTVSATRRLEGLAPSRYRFNAMAGERRRFLFAEWCTGPELCTWLNAGADALASGDIYARLHP